MAASRSIDRTGHYKNWLRSIGAIAQECPRCLAKAFEECKRDCGNWIKLCQKSQMCPQCSERIQACNCYVNRSLSPQEKSETPQSAIPTSCESVD